VNFGELKQVVVDTVQENSDTLTASVGNRINSALLEITEEHDLPSLKKVFTVTTVVSQAYCTFPATFSGRLAYIGTTDGELTILEGGITSLIQLYPSLTETGTISELAIEYPVLWYQKIPAVATVLTCVGYSLPSTLLIDSDTPTDLPVHLHEDLIVNKVLINYYNKIEDGIEGEKVNTENYERRFARAKLQLLNWISRRRITVGRSSWNV
jgi:hypothetical protein